MNGKEALTEMPLKDFACILKRSKGDTSIPSLQQFDVAPDGLRHGGGGLKIKRP